MATPPAGRLFLVPAPLDFGCNAPVRLDRALPSATLVSAASLVHWIAESAKTTRAYLKRVAELHPLAVPLQQMQIVELPREVHKKGDHDTPFDARPLLAPAMHGHDIGLVSEAGLPAVADPGSSVVRAAHDLGIEVIALAGTSSLLLALAASGLNGQNFAFVGYLPQEATARAQRIRELEALAMKGQAQLFIETPYRNQAVWQGLLQTLKPSTRLAVASGLTLDGARTASHAVQKWRELAAPVSNDTPAVFAIGR